MFSRINLIVDAQLDNLRRELPLKDHDSTARISVSKAISISVFKQHNYDGNLKSSAEIHLRKKTASKSRNDSIDVDDYVKFRLGLIIPENFLEKLDFVVKNFSAFKDIKS